MKQMPQDKLIEKVVVLGNKIRQKRQEGNLQSIVPPTIYGYLAFMRMAQALPHLELRQIAMVTLLGNASLEDRPEAVSLCNQVFGLGKNPNPESIKEANLF
jgi:hypothetical protein